MKLNIRAIAKAFGNFFGKHSTKIFAGVAIAGVGVTAYAAGKAAIEAHDKIIETELREDRELTRKEKARIVAPMMLKPVISGVLTAGSMYAAIRHESKKAVTYMGMYALSEATVDSLQAALVDKMGEEAARNFRNDILQKRLKEEPEPKDESDSEQNTVTKYIFTTDDYQWYKDEEYGGEMIRKRPTDIVVAENEFNNRLNTYDYGSVNDLRDILGLERIGIGDDFGFCRRQGLFSFKMDDPKYDSFGRIYIPLRFARPATADYMSR